MTKKYCVIIDYSHPELNTVCDAVIVVEAPSRQRAITIAKMKLEHCLEHLPGLEMSNVRTLQKKVIAYV